MADNKDDIHRRNVSQQPHPRVAGEPMLQSMTRDHLCVRTRDKLPPLHKYPQVQVDKLCGKKQIVGCR